MTYATPDTFTVSRISGHVLETSIECDEEAIEVAIECAKSASGSTVVHFEMSGAREGRRSLVATVDSSGEVTYL